MALTQEEAHTEPATKSAETVPNFGNVTAERSLSPSATEKEISALCQDNVRRSLPGWEAALLRRLLATTVKRQTWLTGSLKQDGHTSLADMLAKNRHYAQQKRMYMRGTLGLTFLIFLSIIQIVALHGISLPMFNMVWAPLALLARGVTASVRQQSAAVAITQFDEVQAVGPLAEALEYPNDLVVPLAEKALIRLLPRLQASDFSLLSSSQRACLYRALWGRSTALALTILNTLERLEETDAIPEVRKLAKNRLRDARTSRGQSAARMSEAEEHSTPPLTRSGGVRLFLLGLPIVALSQEDRAQRTVAAQACLSRLVQSLERQKSGLQLLRPSEATPASDASLLRPTMAQAPAEPSDQLLRPTATLE